MRYYFGQFSTFDGASIFVSRTGYTGEDGFEVIVPANLTVKLWETFIQAGESAELKPCGLGCRDTLRLEAAMPLYGHELSECIDPLTAGLKSSVKLDKSEFVGRDALLKIADREDRPVRVGIKLNSKRIAREHSEIFAADARIGEVTSEHSHPRWNNQSRWPMSLSRIPRLAPVSQSISVENGSSRNRSTPIL